MATPLYHYVEPIMYRGKVAPNLLARIQLPNDTINNSLLFHKYVIEDGDRPDTIAYHYYGDAGYDWMVMLSNRFVSLRQDWPLTEAQFAEAIAKKYGSLQNAYQTLHHYQINKETPNITSATYNALPVGCKRYFTRVATVSGDTTYGITYDDIRLSSGSYAALPAEEQIYWEEVSAFQQEYSENEAKRNILLIDAKYVNQLTQSLKQISKNVF